MMIIWLGAKVPIVLTYRNTLWGLSEGLAGTQISPITGSIVWELAGNPYHAVTILEHTVNYVKDVWKPLTEGKHGYRKFCT